MASRSVKYGQKPTPVYLTDARSKPTTFAVYLLFCINQVTG